MTQGEREKKKLKKGVINMGGFKDLGSTTYWRALMRGKHRVEGLGVMKKGKLGRMSLI